MLRQKYVPQAMVPGVGGQAPMICCWEPLAPGMLIPLERRRQGDNPARSVGALVAGRQHSRPLT